MYCFVFWTKQRNEYLFGTNQEHNKCFVFWTNLKPKQLFVFEPTKNTRIFSRPINNARHCLILDQSRTKEMFNLVTYVIIPSVPRNNFHSRVFKSRMIETYIWRLKNDKKLKDKTRQDRTRQDRTRQDKTGQDKGMARQDNTRRDEKEGDESGTRPVESGGRNAFITSCPDISVRCWSSPER